MFSITSGLQSSKSDIDEHIAAFFVTADDARLTSFFTYVYQCLTILDSKAQTLMGFNSIIIAVFAIFVSGVNNLLELGSSILYAGMALAIFASIVLLPVVWVHWATTNELTDPKLLASDLLVLRNRRTVRYRIAWYLSMLSVFLLLAFLGVEIRRHLS